jgi:hypothetical protein
MLENIKTRLINSSWVTQLRVAKAYFHISYFLRPAKEQQAITVPMQNTRRRMVSIFGAS